MKKIIITAALITTIFSSNVVARTPTVELKTGRCPASLQLTQNLKAPRAGESYIKNGRYHWYTKKIVREAHILQKHLNRLNFNAGVIDGIIGPKTKGAILRLQKFLRTVQDGYIGPKTRALLNNSCGNEEKKDEEKKDNELNGIRCNSSWILTENLQTGNGNGKYSYWEKKNITEAHILQEHLNRLGYSSMSIDGILGEDSRKAIEDLQMELGLIKDGKIGSQTRKILNNSCNGKEKSIKEFIKPKITYSQGNGGQKILDMGKKMIDNKKIIQGACWDYINEVYNKSGYPLTKRVTIFSSSKGKGPYAEQKNIQPGDWLYYVNHSYHNVEHSGIFVKWIDYNKKIGKILSYGGEHRKEPGKYNNFDLKSVYNIIRPDDRVIIIKGDEKKTENNNSMKNEMLKIVNKERKNKNLKSLVFDDKLNAVAQKYAKLMNDDNHYGHMSKKGSMPWGRALDGGYKYRAIAENIAIGQLSVEKVMDGWRKSKGHYGNYMSAKYEDVGFGIYKNENKGSKYGGYYWVQVFGKKW